MEGRTLVQVGAKISRRSHNISAFRIRLSVCLRPKLLCEATTMTVGKRKVAISSRWLVSTADQQGADRVA